MEFIIKAYAKVNLLLEVLNKRKDGYHNIFSLNASINIFDLLKLNIIEIYDDPGLEISVEIIPDGGKYEEVISSITIRENLISKSIEAYLKKIGKSGKISVSIEKNIPTGAGLGGGSSDAAVTLRALNNYFKKITDRELLKLGAEVGADVPYCLTGGFAICEGIGDQIEKLEGILDSNIVLLYPGVNINTGEAYKGLRRDCINLYNEGELENKRQIIRQGIKMGDLNFVKSILINDFEKPVFDKYPGIRAKKEEMKDLEADYVTMTGSGSALMGLFNDYHKAKAAEKSLKIRGYQVFVTDFVCID